MPLPLLLLFLAVAPAATVSSPPPPLLSCATTDGGVSYLPTPLPDPTAHAPVRLGPAPRRPGVGITCRLMTGGAGPSPATSLVWNGSGRRGGGTLFVRRRAPLAAAPAPALPPSSPPGPALATLSIPPAPAPASSIMPSTANDTSISDLVLIYRPPTGGNTNNSRAPVATAAANTTVPSPTPPPCDALALLHGRTGSFGVPRYSPRTACGWVLDPGYAPIRLTAVRFETEPGFDSVFVMALSQAGLRTRVAELSGRLPAGRVILVPSRRAFIGFLSDATVEGGGWEFTWDRGPACAPVAEVAGRVEGLITDGSDPPGGDAGPDGGAVPGTRCEWQVRPPPGAVTFSLTRLALPVGASLAFQGAARSPVRLLTGDRSARLPRVRVPASSRGPDGDDAVFVVFDVGQTTGAGFALKWWVEEEVEEEEEVGGGGGDGTGATLTTRGGGRAFLPRSPSGGGSVSALGGGGVALSPPSPPLPFKNADTLAREEEAAEAAAPDLGWDGFVVPPGAARAIIASGALAGGVILGTALGCAGAQLHAILVYSRRYGGRWWAAPGLAWARRVGGALRWRRRRRPGGGGGAVAAPPQPPTTPRVSPPESPRRRRGVGATAAGEVGLTAMRGAGGGGGGGAPQPSSPPSPLLARP